MHLPNLGIWPRDATEPTVRINGLDGSHMGPALSLWRAALANDDDVRTTVHDEFYPETVFASCIELLLNQAHMVAELEAVCPTQECDGGARFMFHLAHTTDLERFSLLCHQIAQALARRPHLTRLRVTPVPVLDLLGLCMHVGTLIEDRADVAQRDQTDLLESLMLSTLEGSQ